MNPGSLHIGRVTLLTGDKSQRLSEKRSEVRRSRGAYLGLVQTSEQESGAGQGEQKTQQEQELVHSAGAPPGLKHPRSVLWLQLGREKQQIQVSAPHDSAPWGPPSPSRKSMRGRGFPHSTARLPPGGGARPALQSYQLGGC